MSTIDPAYIEGDFQIKQDANDDYGNLSVANNATVGNDLTVSHDASITGDLAVTGDAVFVDARVGDDLDVTGDASVGGDLTVTGTATVGGILTRGTVDVANKLSASELEVTGDASIGGVLTLAADPTGNLEAATKHYVDSGVNVYMGMGIYTKIATLSTPTVALADDTGIYAYTIVDNTTLAFDATGLTSTTGKAITFELYLTMPSTAYTITFPASVSWLNNEVPSMSTPSKTYMFVFRSIDGGTTWLGSKEGAY